MTILRPIIVGGVVKEEYVHVPSIPSTLSKSQVLDNSALIGFLLVLFCDCITIRR